MTHSSCDPSDISPSPAPIILNNTTTQSVSSTTTTISPDSSRPQTLEQVISFAEKPTQVPECVTTTQYTTTTNIHQEPIPPLLSAKYIDLSSSYRATHSGIVADWPSRTRHFVLAYVVDWICVAIVLCLLGLWFAKPPVFYFTLTDITISYPIVPQTVSAAAITIIIIAGPLFVVAIAQIWVRSWRDFHQSALATLQLFGITQLICTVLWCLVGGLRPSFLALCKPSVPIPTSPYPVVWYTDSICTCSEFVLNHAKHSFPSGHATSITAMCVYLIIYLSAKLKIYDNRSHLWKFLVAVVPLLIIDLWISFSRIRDGQHFLKDVLIGMIIGIITGVLIYRLNYCSLIGPDNHIPCRYLWLGRYFTKNNRTDNVIVTGGTSGKSGGISGKSGGISDDKGAGIGNEKVPVQTNNAGSANV